MEFEDKRDNKIYKVVQIDGILWLAENLNYNTSGSWVNNNNSSNGDIFGRLYTAEAAISACPNGWIVPTSQELENLLTYAGGKETYGKKLKSTNRWQSDNSTDDYEFDFLLAGVRNSDGVFYDLNTMSTIWSSTSPDPNDDYYCCYTFTDGNDNILSRSGRKEQGYSVRCIKK